jgi:hypothetical protein
MPSPLITNLEKLLGTPRDGALLRYSLGTEYLKAGERERGIAALREAVARDPQYSAAWKSLGRALAEDGREDEAYAAWTQGIAPRTPGATSRQRRNDGVRAPPDEEAAHEPRPEPAPVHAGARSIRCRPRPGIPSRSPHSSPGWAWGGQHLLFHFWPRGVPRSAAHAPRPVHGAHAGGDHVHHRALPTTR